VGSRARSDIPADEFSDHDLVLFVRDPAPLLEEDAWVERFGSPKLTFQEPTAVGDQRELRVLYSDGSDVDFAIVPLEFLEHEAVALVAVRGARILVDKDGELERRLAAIPPPQAPGQPDPAEFRNVSSDFWYHAVWGARKLRRGELLVAKGCIDGHLKALLLQLLEWHARATDPHADTWHRGRFFERWADPGAVTALRGAYGGYEEADLARALSATMDLFARVERETAELLGLQRPAEGAAFARALVGDLLEERGPH
jgi:aminoglycoside 6-adenylyltransferase